MVLWQGQEHMWQKAVYGMAVLGIGKKHGNNHVGDFYLFIYFKKKVVVVVTVDHQQTHGTYSTNIQSAL